MAKGAKRPRQFFSYGQKSFIMRPFFAFRQKASSYRGAFRVLLLVCLSVCVCVTLVVVTDYKSCTRPISTNPGSLEAGEYRLTRGRGRWADVGFVVCFRWGRIFSFFFFEHTRPAASMRPPLASFTFLLVRMIITGIGYHRKPKAGG